MNNPDYTLISDTPLFKGKFREILARKTKGPDGQIIDREIIKRNHFVVMFPITKEGKVILIKEFRFGPQKEYFDIPGGAIDGNETAIEAAKREILEETGYGSENVVFLGETYYDAYIDGKMSIVILFDCEKKSSKTESEITLKDLKEFFKDITSMDSINYGSIMIAKDYLRNNNLL